MQVNLENELKTPILMLHIQIDKHYGPFVSSLPQLYFFWHLVYQTPMENSRITCYF